MSRIARITVNGRLYRNTFCSGAEVVPVQCKRGLNIYLLHFYLLQVMYSICQHRFYVFSVVSAFKYTFYILSYAL